MASGSVTEEAGRWKAEQAHGYLEEIRRAGESCAGISELVDDARSRASGLSGVDYAAPRTSSARGPDAIPDAVARIQEMAAAYVAELCAYEEARHEANASMLTMGDASSAKVLRLRYLCGWSWERICSETGYSWDGMMSLRRRALAEFWDVMPRGARDPVPPAI